MNSSIENIFLQNNRLKRNRSYPNPCVETDFSKVQTILVQDDGRQVCFKFTRQNSSIFYHCFINTFAPISLA